MSFPTNSDEVMPLMKHLDVSLSLFALWLMCGVIPARLMAQEGAVLVQAQEPQSKRRALLVAAQEGHPDMQKMGAPFPLLQYPTRDVVLLYQALKSEQAGAFNHVTVVAARRQLDRLQDMELRRLQQTTLSEAERLESAQVLSGISSILHDPDTYPDTLQDWPAVTQSNTRLEAERERLLKERVLQCGRVEGKSFEPLLFPCAKDVTDALREFQKDTTAEDDVLIYFSGHGFRTSPFKNGVLSVGSRMLVVADTYIDRAQKREPAYHTLSVGALLESIISDSTRHTLVVLAACASPLYRTKDTPPGEDAYAPIVVRQFNTKGGNATRVVHERLLPGLEILGAAQEEALESLTPPILGDVFTYYLRMILEGNFSRLGLDPSFSADWDGDGAVSVVEAFYFIEAQMRGLPSGPYYIESNNDGLGFILRGKVREGTRKAMLFPPTGLRLTASRSKAPASQTSSSQGTASTGAAPELWAELHLDGKRVENPTGLDARLHTYELISELGQRYDVVRYAASPGQQLRWENLFRLRHGELSLSLGATNMWGPAAYPQGTHQLWSSLALRLGLHHTQLYLRGEALRLQVGGDLQLSSSAPAQAGNVLTTQSQGALSGGIRLSQRLPLPFQSWVQLGVYPGMSYLSLFEFRNTMLAGHLLSELSMTWQLSPRQRVGLGLSVRGYFADLDCQTDNRIDTDDFSFETLLQTRCAMSTNAEGQVVFTPQPGLYLEPMAALQWHTTF